MKKTMLFIIFLTISSLLTIKAQDIDNSVGGWLECKAIEQAETSPEDPVHCDYFAYWETDFTCPSGSRKLCYGCTCTFESGATIVTTACECK